MRSKDQVRRAVWRAMDREGVSRFPGAEGRIPNFAGAKLAAQKLAGPPAVEAGQGHQGEPGLAADARPPARARGGEEDRDGRSAAARPAPVPAPGPAPATKAQVREAATIKGALQARKVVALEEIPKIDFVLCGSVAVNLSGARLGKGGGFSDLEYGMLIEEGKIGDRTQVATTVHPIQILREHLMITDHDLPVDLIATPRAVIEVERTYERPKGILWDHLQPPQIHEIPVLERMGYA